MVAYVRKTLEIEARARLSTKKRPKIKVGHGGTLDPLAEGVLVLGVGKGTKVMGEYLAGPKRYEATFDIGYTTDTLDTEGTVTSRTDATLLVDPEVISKFKGEIMQVPPMYSAIRKNGRRLYELAREGQTYDDVVVEARQVVVEEVRNGVLKKRRPQNKRV